MTSEPLPPPAVAELLRSASTIIHAEISAPVLAWHPAAGEWCVKEVLGHLIETEKRGFRRADPHHPVGRQPAARRLGPGGGRPRPQRLRNGVRS